MRQGIKTDFIIKELFEGGITSKAFSQLVNAFQNKAFTRSSSSEIMKCMSKQVNFNQLEVEEVKVANLQVPRLDVCPFVTDFFHCPCIEKSRRTDQDKKDVKKKVFGL